MSRSFEDDREVVVIRTGTANLASVDAALRRRGATPRLTRDPAVVWGARRVILPGVGAFEPARRQLAEGGLDRALRARLDAGGPLLAICLGLQLLAEGSDEAPGLAGLGVLPGRARRLDAAPRLPHMGWNRVEVTGDARWLRPGTAYFAHSYALPVPPADAIGRTRYGAPFLAAVEQGALLGCQFHPELSGAWGAALLERWLVGAAVPVGSTETKGAL